MLNTETTVKERPNVHPHLLTGAKGFDTMVFGQESVDVQRGFNYDESLLSQNKQISAYHFNDEAMQFETLSENSVEVCHPNIYFVIFRSQTPQFVN